jgi:hypothetical protein
VARLQRLPRSKNAQSTNDAAHVTSRYQKEEEEKEREKRGRERRRERRERKRRKRRKREEREEKEREERGRGERERKKREEREEVEKERREKREERREKERERERKRKREREREIRPQVYHRAISDDGAHGGGLTLGVQSIRVRNQLASHCNLCMHPTRSILGAKKRSQLVPITRPSFNVWSWLLLQMPLPANASANVAARMDG